MESNSFSLDPDLKEARGLPALRMTYKDHPDDLKLGAFLRDRILELLDATDAVQKWASSIEEQDFAYHLLGTCRMGNDPKSSVINADHRAHDMKNLQPGHFGPRAADGNDQRACLSGGRPHHRSDAPRRDLMTVKLAAEHVSNGLTLRAMQLTV